MEIESHIGVRSRVSRERPIHRERDKDSSRERVVSVFRELGLEALLADPASQDLVERSVLLEQKSNFFEAEVNALRLAKKIFDHCAATPEAFTTEEQEVVRIGTVLSDISKTGPRAATVEQQELMLLFYQVENLPKAKQTTIESFLQQHWPRQREQALAVFSSLSIGDPQTMTMEEFFNLHSQWTYDILRNLPLSPEVIQAASLHHKLKADLVPALSDDALFTRSAQLVNLLDMYEAFITRSDYAHRQAMDILHEIIARHHERSYHDSLLGLWQIMDDTFRPVGEENPTV